MSFELILLLSGAFAMAFSIGAVGFGDALIAIAFWLQIMTPLEAVPLIVACGVVNSAFSLWRLRGRLDHSKLMPFLISGVVGIPLGTWLLGFAEPTPFRLAAGIFLTVYGAVFLFLRRLPAINIGGAAADGAVGLVGGVLGGLAGLSGVLPTLWCGLRGWSKEMQRGAFQPYILAMHALAFVSAAVAGLVDIETGKRFAMCLPFLIAGTIAGLACYGRLDERRFRDVVLGILLASGIALVATSA
ncbi:MAG: sulfite exporter TauE/SafE family protein [Proteobacteria bacterium]|nr:sulfite exporter TauE/SafE family protein [Pseudomonadota bacterium]